MNDFSPSSSERAFRKREGTPFLLAALALNLLLVSLVVFFLWENKLSVETSAHKRSEALALAISQEIESDYRAVDLGLKTVVDEVASQHQPHNDQMIRWLVKIRGHHPALDALRISNAAGEVLYESGLYSPATNPKIADRDYFVKLRDDPNAGLQISDPLIGRTSGKSVIVLARRLEDGNGRFAGVVFGAIPVDRFAKLIRQFELGPNDAIVFRGPGMKVVVRYPEIPSFQSGTPFKTSAFEQALQENPAFGHYDTGSQTPDGIDRMYSYLRNHEYGFYVNAGLAREDVFAGWKKQTSVIAGVVVLLLLASTLLAIKLRRAWLDEISDGLLLAASESRFKSFFDSAMIGMAVTSLDKGWLMVNPALCEILGYPAAELVTKSWADLTHPDDLAADVAHFNRVLAGETDGYSMEKRFVRPDGQIVDALISARAVRKSTGEIVFFSASVENISAQKIAERELRSALTKQVESAEQIVESERRIRLLARHAAAFIYELDCDGTIRFVNRVSGGLREDQMLGTGITDWFPFGLRLTVSTALNQSIADRKEEVLEYEIPDSAGVLKTYETRLTPVLVDDAVRSVVLTANDITERKQFERQLLNSRELLRQFFDHFPGTAFVKNDELRILMASSGFSAQLGMDPATMIGRSNDELFPAAFGAKITADDRRILASGKTECFEEEYSGRYYESTKFLISQADQKSLLGGVTVDITHRVRNRQRAEAMLALASLGGTVPEREFLRAGLHQAEAITGSTIGFLHFVNEDQETIELVTWTDGALKGCQASYDSHYPISKAGIWANCFHERAPVVFNDYAAEMEKKGLPPGHAKLDRLISVPVIEQGMVRMMIGVGNRSSDYDDFDIQSVQLIGNDLWRVVRRQRAEQAVIEKLDQMTRLNQQLSQAQNQLLQSEKMATIGQLAAGVAHELNNPIGFIQSNLGTLDGYIDDLLTIIDHAVNCSQSCSLPDRTDQLKVLLMEKDFKFLRQDVRDLLAESKDGADRVHRIVQNLKDFSHVSEDEWIWTDLHQGLESTLRLVWNEVKYRAEVEKQFGVLPQVFCLASQLNQVFMNLLVNAAQAIEAKGKIILRTGVEIDPRDENAKPSRVWIEIQDNGNGIPAENLQRIFDPFFTTKPVGKGTGLGLSLAWSIVQKHKGNFTVESKVGVGTTFRISLPINGRGDSEGVVRNE